MANINNKPCETCTYYDPIMKGNPKGGVKETNHAWCAKLSVYPYAEGPGQLFPKNVKRVSLPEHLAIPKIVRRTEVVVNCVHYQEKTKTPSKAALIEKLRNPRKPQST